MHNCILFPKSHISVLTRSAVSLKYLSAMKIIHTCKRMRLRLFFDIIKFDLQRLTLNANIRSSSIYSNFYHLQLILQLICPCVYPEVLFSFGEQKAPRKHVLGQPIPHVFYFLDQQLQIPKKLKNFVYGRTQ